MCSESNTLYSACPTEAVLTRWAPVRSILETNRNQQGTNFNVFRRVLTAAKIGFVKSVCPYVRKYQRGSYWTNIRKI